MSAKSKFSPVEIVVVAHTHWDREWYLPFQRFRFRLVQLVDQVLEMLEAYSEFIFLLDGQTIILDDYLEIRPENEDKLKRFIREGRLLIGPWYTQPDEFLVSGEALVRNLLLGIRQASAFGDGMREGYVPDAFGHTAQLPQIFRGFGIESAFLMRGIGDRPEKSEFWWEGPDGSRVLAHRFVAEYGNAARLDDFERLRQMTQRLQAAATTPVVLWMHGNDHCAPQRDVIERLRQLQAAWPDVRIQLGTLKDFLERVKAHRPKLKTIRGELRGSKHAFLLSNVFSTRIHLKQQNVHIQALLEHYAEPLAAWAWLLGSPYPKGFLATAWRLLLQNHAHDSICGCSVDEVHREMGPRFAQAQQIAEEIIEASLTHIGQHIPAEEESESRLVMVYNPSPWPQQGRVVVAWPLCDESQGAPEALIDDEGHTTVCVPVGETLRSLDVLEGVRTLTHRLLAFYADVPPLGYRVYRPVFPSEIKANPASPHPPISTRSQPQLVVDDRTLENEFFRLSVHHDGTFTLEDKRSGHVYTGLHFFEDTADAGDEYNYAPLADDPPLLSITSAERVQVELADEGPHWATLRVRIDWALPASLTSDRQRRAAHRVPYPIISEITLQRGVARIEIRTIVENVVKDHRLRVGFPLGRPVQSSWAETAFGIVERPVRLPEGRDWLEPPTPTHPQGRFVAAQAEGRGLAALNRGLPEYELTEDGTLYLTLLRCVGWLSRDDLPTRPGHAGPPYPTPEAQCPGCYEFHYALVPYTGSWEEARIWQSAFAFCAPLWAQAVSAGKDKGSLPLSASFLQIEPDELVLSAIKQAEDEEGVIIRLYNTTAKDLTARVKSLWPIRQAHRTNLEETPQEELSVAPDGSVRFQVRPWEIVTLKLLF